MLHPKLYPLTFHPIFKERIWGGNNLKRLFGKALPDGKRIGESWEISDREGDVSLIQQGALCGMNLHKLIESRSREMMGNASLLDGRFPLLMKILDAHERLSLQVHPPKSIAEKLGGESKTELWYLADCQKDARVFVGTRKGMNRDCFENRLQSDSIADCFHSLATKKGEAIFLPSGRVHGIGAGNVIFEIQENSDTTYRVYDWDRVGLDGKARQLHLSKSMASIDFEDFEPSFVTSIWETMKKGVNIRVLADCAEFGVQQIRLSKCTKHRPSFCNVPLIYACVSGKIMCRGNGVNVLLHPGQFCLLPAAVNGEFETADDSAEGLLAIAR